MPNVPLRGRLDDEAKGIRFRFLRIQSVGRQPNSGRSALALQDLLAANRAGGSTRHGGAARAQQWIVVVIGCERERRWLIDFIQRWCAEPGVVRTAQQHLLGGLPTQADLRIECVAEVAVVVEAPRQRQIDLARDGNCEFRVQRVHFAAAACIGIRICTKAAQLARNGSIFEAGFLLPPLIAQRH